MSKFTKSFLFPVIIVNLLITAYILFFQEGLFFNDIYNPNGIKIEIFGSKKKITNTINKFIKKFLFR